MQDSLIDRSDVARAAQLLCNVLPKSFVSIIKDQAKAESPGKHPPPPFPSLAGYLAGRANNTITHKCTYTTCDPVNEEEAMKRGFLSQKHVPENNNVYLMSCGRIHVCGNGGDLISPCAIDLTKYWITNNKTVCSLTGSSTVKPPSVYYDLPSPTQVHVTNSRDIITRYVTQKSTKASQTSLQPIRDNNKRPNPSSSTLVDTTSKRRKVEGRAAIVANNSLSDRTKSEVLNIRDTVVPFCSVVGSPTVFKTTSAVSSAASFTRRPFGGGITINSKNSTKTTTATAAAGNAQRGGGGKRGKKVGAKSNINTNRPADNTFKNPFYSPEIDRILQKQERARNSNISLSCTNNTTNATTTIFTTPTPSTPVPLIPPVYKDDILFQFFRDPNNVYCLGDLYRLAAKNPAIGDKEERLTECENVLCRIFYGQERARSIQDAFYNRKEKCTKEIYQYYYAKWSSSKVKSGFVIDIMETLPIVTKYYGPNSANGIIEEYYSALLRAFQSEIERQQQHDDDINNTDANQWSDESSHSSDCDSLDNAGNVGNVGAGHGGNRGNTRDWESAEQDLLDYEELRDGPLEKNDAFVSFFKNLCWLQWCIICACPLNNHGHYNRGGAQSSESPALVLKANYNKKKGRKRAYFGRSVGIGGLVGGANRQQQHQGPMMVASDRSVNFISCCISVLYDMLEGYTFKGTVVIPKSFYVAKYAPPTNEMSKYGLKKNLLTQGINQRMEAYNSLEDEKLFEMLCKFNF